MDLKKVLSFLPYPGNYLHPVVYACTAVMLLCLLVSMVTYMVHHSVIRINRKGWHILLNFLFHTGLTFAVFAGGINQIHLPLVCQSVGVVLHYSSLSSMLWLMFTARNICHDVSKDALQAQNRNGPTKPRNEPTILRFYLISDGIPLIIVGVTAAFGLDNYGSSANTLYCWMAWEPSLGGFYSPVAVLVLVMSVYFLSTYIQLKRHPERKYELRVVSEEQRLSSCDSNQYCCTEAGPASEPVGDGSAFAAGVSMLANEQSFKSQLRATAFTLFLYLSTWALGGLAVSQGPLLDMIFSCLYGAFCVSLGLFLLIQHCAKRDDVWHRWWACCPSKSKSKSEDKDGGGQSRTQVVHQSHSHLGSPYSGKQHSPQLLQSSYHKVAPPSPSTGPCCVAVISPVVPLKEPTSSPCPQPLPEELPRPVLPLQSCLVDRAKSHSFSRPRPCLQDFRTHLNSVSMDGCVQSPHVDIPVHRLQRSKSPHPDLKLPFTSTGSCHTLQRQTSCHSVQDSKPSCQNHSPDVVDRITSCHSLHLPAHAVHTCQWSMCSSGDPSSSPGCCYDQLEPYTSQYRQEPDSYSCTPKTPAKDKYTLSVDVEQKGFPRNTLPRRHGAVSLRDTITRNRSLQEDNFYGLDVSRNIRTGPWKNETSV